MSKKKEVKKILSLSLSKLSKSCLLNLPDIHKNLRINPQNFVDLESYIV